MNQNSYKVLFTCVQYVHHNLHDKCLGSNEIVAPNGEATSEIQPRSPDKDCGIGGL